MILLFQEVSASPLPNLLLKKRVFYFILTWNILIVYIYKNSQTILLLSLVFVVPRFLTLPFFTINDIHLKENLMCFNFYSSASPLFWFWCQKWGRLLGLSRGELSLCLWLHCQEGNLLGQWICPFFRWAELEDRNKHLGGNGNLYSSSYLSEMYIFALSFGSTMIWNLGLC